MLTANLLTKVNHLNSPKSNDGSILIDPTRKAQLLQTIFTFMYTTDNGHIPVFSTPPVTNTSLSNVIFSFVLVKRAIANLRLSPKVVLMAYHLSSSRLALTNSSTPLAYVYSQCMEFSYLPPDCLRAHITPVFKKGDPSCPLNYRPIALTCTICKIIEVIIKDQLLNYLLRNSLISKHQYGF